MSKHLEEDHLNYRKVGDVIRIRRIILGYSQQAVAEGAKMSKNHFARIERGEINGSLGAYFNIAHVLGLSVDAILQELYDPKSDTFLSAITTEMATLTPDQRQLVFAFIKTLKEYRDLQF